MARQLTDYEKYIRTEELLSLQKAPDALTCHDEMQFQIVTGRAGRARHIDLSKPRTLMLVGGVRRRPDLDHAHA